MVVSSTKKIQCSIQCKLTPSPKRLMSLFSFHLGEHRCQIWEGMIGEVRCGTGEVRETDPQCSSYSCHTWRLGVAHLTHEWRESIAQFTWHRGQTQLELWLFPSSFEGESDIESLRAET